MTPAQKVRAFRRFTQAMMVAGMEVEADLAAFHAPGECAKAVSMATERRLTTVALHMELTCAEWDREMTNAISLERRTTTHDKAMLSYDVYAFAQSAVLLADNWRENARTQLGRRLRNYKAWKQAMRKATSVEVVLLDLDKGHPSPHFTTNN